MKKQKIKELDKISKDAIASEFLNRYSERIDKYIPEQIFEDKSCLSITTLLWSEAMFVIAARFLGHI